MADASTLDILNRLLRIHYRSLPMYLGFANPSWQYHGDVNAQKVLAAMVTEQRRMVDRIGEMIIANDGGPEYGEFPMRFTAYHDLSFDFLLRKLIEDQQQGLAEINECVRKLSHAPIARALAEEALGAAKGHLESLQELGRTSLVVT